MTPATEFHLVPLDCPTCGAGVHAEGRDVVYYCTACRNGYRFDDERRALEPVAVGFVAAPSRAVERYLPFWKLPAEVRILDRRGGGFSRLLSLFGGGPGDSSEGGTVFVVPAFDTSLEAAIRLTRRYSAPRHELDELLGERLLGGCYGVEDARKLAHFALLASEVDKSDTLRDLEYEIDFGEARLLGVPFRREGERWVDSLHGIEI